MSNEGSNEQENELSGLKKITPEESPSEVSSDPDSDTEEELLDHTKKLHALAISSAKLDLQLRENFAKRIFKFVCFWVSGVGALLLLQGYSGYSKFSLSDKVLMAVIGATTANIIGLLYVVANYLFPKK
jgi:hypothetical protein